MNTFRILMIGVVLSLLAGCATKPISNEEAMPTPPERILDQTLFRPIPEAGQVTVKRDGGFLGGACTTRIFVDAVPVADIDVAEKIAVFLTEGDHIISAWPNGICGGGMVETRASVKRNGKYNFRVGYGSNGDFSIFATAF